LYLNTQFRNLVQGDLCVDDYCRRMKTMYNDLRDLGAHIDGRTLVLNLLRGLNKKFDSMKTVMKWTKPLTSFREVWNDFLLEELTLDVEATSESTSAFTTSSGPQQRHQTSSTTFDAPRAPPPSDGSDGHGSSGGGSGRGGGHGLGGSGHGHGGRSGGSSTSSGCQGKGNPCWPSPYNP
jgi:uncharacterized membrane protein YgcG